MNNIVLHIPHSSLKVPNWYHKLVSNKNMAQYFNTSITDLETDKLFGNNKFTKIVFPYSRIFCDVEKFADDSQEIMSQFGMGFVYTKTHLGEQFFYPTEQYKKLVYDKYYIKHHNKLNKVVKKSLTKNKTILIDCHSFSKEIIMFEEKKENLPDICIGFDKLYYNENLINFIKNYFISNGYSVKLNYPYSGTMIPNDYFKNIDDNLLCVMIEINKRLYLNDNLEVINNIFKVQVTLNNLFKNLTNLDIC